MQKALIAVMLATSMAAVVAGCDKTLVPQDEMPSFEEVGLKHNAAVAEVFAQIRTNPGKSSLLIDPEQVGRLVWQTSAVYDLSGGAHSFEEYNEHIDQLRTYVRERAGISKNDTVSLSVDQLKQAGILSGAQAGYIREIDAVKVAVYDSLAISAAIRSIEERAYSELGDEANIVLIYSATLRHSLSYWNREGMEWIVELSGSASKAMDVDWESVAKHDAGGAVVGAIGGAIAGAKLALGASLMFGPGGGVMVFSGSLLKGIVAGGAAASIHEGVVGAL